MTHNDYQLLISRDLDGDLSKEEKLLLDIHLRGCKKCQKVYKEMTGLSNILNGSYKISYNKKPMGKTFFHTNAFKIAASILVVCTLSISSFVGLEIYNQTKNTQAVEYTYTQESSSYRNISNSVGYSDGDDFNQMLSSYFGNESDASSFGQTENYQPFETYFFYVNY